MPAWPFQWKPNTFVCGTAFLIHIFVTWKMRSEVFSVLEVYDFDMGVLFGEVSKGLRRVGKTNI